MMGYGGRAWAAALLTISAISVCACSGGDEVEGSGGATTTAPPPDDDSPSGVPNLGHRPKSTPPSNVVGGFSLDLPPLTLDPGAELSICFLAPIALKGPSRIIGGGKLSVAPGLHHGNVTTRPKTGDTIRLCETQDDGVASLNVLKGGAVLFGSSTQVTGDEWQTLPDGMGFRLPEGHEIALDMHYLNPTSEPMTVAPHYEWYAIDEASVTQVVGPFAWRAAGFTIPAGSELTYTSSCGFPKPMKLVHLLPHMHRLGVSLTASYLGGPADGELFLDSPGYDPSNGVMVAYDPPVDLGQGYGVTFSCKWRNTLPKAVVEGLGDNEMCILFGYAYPPEDAFTAVGLGEESACTFLAPPKP